MKLCRRCTLSLPEGSERIQGPDLRIDKGNYNEWNHNNVTYLNGPVARIRLTTVTEAARGLIGKRGILGFEFGKAFYSGSIVSEKLEISDLFKPISF